VTIPLEIVMNGLPHLTLEVYEGRDYPMPVDRIKEMYSPRVLGQDNVVPCLLLHADALIGYVQFYPITQEERSAYGLPAEYEIGGVYGIDQFIGEAGLWNRGIGTRAVSLLLQYLFRVKGACRVYFGSSLGKGTGDSMLREMRLP